MRKWLNEDFFYAAFSGTEYSAICSTTLDNCEMDGYEAESGANKIWQKERDDNATRDMVFLLSYDQARLYFGVNDPADYGRSGIKMSVSPTAYAVSHGAFLIDEARTTDGEPGGIQWLRDHSSGDNGLYVNPDDSVDSEDGSQEGILALPAIWVTGL